MKKIIVGNWKMNKTRNESISFIEDIEKNMPQASAQVVIAPPFVYLEAVKNIAGKIKLAAQDCFWEEFGAYTGEVSARQLADFCSYVIIGHSERRSHFKETNEIINRKIKAAINARIIPILCIGEDLSQRESTQTENVLREELQQGLDGLSAKDISQIIIAYEPIWSISTTENRKDCTKEDAEKTSILIKKISKEISGGTFQGKIFFGGNINPENAHLYLKSDLFDGCLVGGASLGANSFIEIIKKAE